MYPRDGKETDIQHHELTTALFGKPAPGRVLVVDDDPSTALLLRSVCKSEGYEVVGIDDGRKAYRMLKSDADFVAAVFNLTMPHLPGAELVRYMKTEKRLMRIPVIMVAGNQGLKVIADSFAAGALAFLPKPFTTDQLALTLRLAIQSRAVPKRAYPQLRIIAA